MSWKKVLEIIDVRIGLVSDAESGSLRHWREAISKTCADFEASFPGEGPSLLASLAVSMDGRMESSAYPNLMVPKERERYGL
jgi:hypothetical protein